VYGAWVGGATEVDLACLQDAMTRSGLPDDVERGPANRVRAGTTAPQFRRKVKLGTGDSAGAHRMPSSPGGSALSEESRRAGVSAVLILIDIC
jgi:hypothetical protein